MTLHVIFTYLSILQPQMILIFTLPQQLVYLLLLLLKKNIAQNAHLSTMKQIFTNFTSNVLRQTLSILHYK